MSMNETKIITTQGQRPESYHVSAASRAESRHTVSASFEFCNDAGRMMSVFGARPAAVLPMPTVFSPLKLDRVACI